MKTVCIVNNVHGLLLYLLKYPEQIEHTHFIVGNKLFNSVELEKSKVTVFNLPTVNTTNLFKLFYYISVYYFYIPFLKFKYRNYDFIGQDCLFFSNIMKKSSVVIEDGDRTYMKEPPSVNKLHSILFPL